MDTIETFNVDGYTVRIHPDTDAESPDAWGDDDDAIFLAYDCRRVAAGREGYARDGVSHSDTHHVYRLCVNDGSYTILYLGDAVLPRDDDEEEEREEGYVYVSRAEWPDEDAARKAAAALVETWNMYLSGDVYGYVVVDEEGDEVDSCWGFYGIDAAREEGKASAQSHAAAREADTLDDADAGNLPPGEPDDTDSEGSRYYVDHV